MKSEGNMKMSFKIIVLLLFLISASWSDVTFTEVRKDITVNGRTSKYAIGIPSTYVPGTPAGVLVFFHGNNSGSHDDMIRIFMPGIQREAERLDLIPVVIASPDTKRGSMERQWSEEQDPEFVHEIFKSNFGGEILLDTERVYLFGASQGTCFINAFHWKYINEYGGGAFGDCGCYNKLMNHAKVDEDTRENYRMFIRAQTGDFLHEPSVMGYEYYRWTLKLKNVRAHLTSPGGHCSAGAVSTKEALDYITGRSEIPEPANEPHWERIADWQGVSSLRIGSLNELIAGVEDDGDPKVMVSYTQGDTWVKVDDFPGDSVLSVAPGLNGDILVLTRDSGFKRYDQNFNLLAEENVNYREFAIDNMGNVFRVGGGSHRRLAGSPSQVSIDGGVSWTDLGGVYHGGTGSLGEEFINTQSDEVILTSPYGGMDFENGNHNPDDLTLAPVHLVNKDGDLKTLNLPSISYGSSWYYLNLAMQGTKVSAYWADAGSGRGMAYVSENSGQNWSPVSMPVNQRYHWSGAGLTLFHDQSLIAHGPLETRRSFNNGQTWERMKGLFIMWNPRWARDKDGVEYVTSYWGIHRNQTWISEEDRPAHTGPEVVTSLKTPQGLSENYRLMNDILIFESHEYVEVYVVNSLGQQNKLYRGNPQGKAIVKIEDQANNSYLVLKSMNKMISIPLQK